MIQDREQILTVAIGMREMLVEVKKGGNRKAIERMASNDPQKRKPVPFTDDADLLHTRFAALVDQYGNVLNSVTPRTYHPIQNSEIIAALDLASDNAGIDMVAKYSNYYKGRSIWRLADPNPFHVPGDDSPHFTMMDVWHDGRGTGGLRANGGIFRQWCTNGCTHQIVAATQYTTHRKKVNLLEFFTEVVSTMMEKAGMFKETHIQAGETEIDLQTPNPVRAALTEIYRNTAPRYRPRLTETIRRYTTVGDGRDEVGPTVHALIQSVADVATHQMQDGVTRHDWNHQSTDALVEAMVAMSTS